MHGFWSAMDKRFVLTLGIGNAAKRGSETDTISIMGRVGGVVQATVFECQLDRRHRELCVTVQTFQSMRGKNSLRRPIQDLACAGRLEDRSIQGGHRADARFFIFDRVPERFFSDSDGCDWSDSSDDDSPHFFST